MISFDFAKSTSFTNTKNAFIIKQYCHLEAAFEPLFRLPVPVVGRIEAQVGRKGVGAVALRQLLQQAGQLAQALPLILVVQDLLPSAHQAL